MLVMIARVLIVALALGLAPTPFEASATAQSFDPRSNFSADQARRQRSDGQVISLGEALAVIERRFPGFRHRDSWMTSRRGVPVHVVRIQWRGGLYDVYVDGRAATILSVREV